MCGLVGYINKKTTDFIQSNEQILDMMMLQKHRGPDDSGVCAFNLDNSELLEVSETKREDLAIGYNGIVGFNRLSILDLSHNGHQPMIAPGNDVILLMNGEIYNAFDFKKELENDGYRFKSTSDTEIVLALYLKYGLEKMLELLNGMFAMVILDLRLSVTYLVRDRFGIKPMYFISNEDVFAFSSELKSFKKLRNFKFSLNEQKLDEYLMFRGLISGTLIKGIDVLLPGHYIKYSAGNYSIHEYFDINKYNRKVKVQNYNKARQVFLRYFSKSIQSQLISDVKIGTQLSGGIDSTLVTMLAKEISANNNIDSVSVVFDEKQFTESGYIKQVVDKLGVKNYSFTLTDDYFIKHINEITWFYEAPLNHPNTVGIYKLSQEAKKYVTVLLSGEGADEVFGGYGKFRSVVNPYFSIGFLKIIYNAIFKKGSFIRHFSPVYRAVYSSAFSLPGQITEIYPRFNSEMAMQSRRSLYRAQKGSLFDRQVKYEFKSYLPDLLIRQDKMSMANSIENRVPFLDNDLVEKSFEISVRNLVKSRFSSQSRLKYLLKRIVSDVFGKNFAYRRKMGFGIPLRSFLGNPEFRDYSLDVLLPGMKDRGLFDTQIIENWLNDIQSIKYQELETLWIVLAFEIWAKTYIDDTNSDNPINK